jgi:hypothetical protein
MEAMKARRVAGLAVVATIVALIAIIWWLLAGSREPPPVESFRVEEVPVDSPQLELAMDEIRGELRDGYMEWACLVRCLEAAGCRADIVLTIHYTSSGEKRQILFSGMVDVPSGSRARLGGVQRAPWRVDSVQRVEVIVDRLYRRGDPPPTPEY